MSTRMSTASLRRRLAVVAVAASLALGGCSVDGTDQRTGVTAAARDVDDGTGVWDASEVHEIEVEVDEDAVAAMIETYQETDEKEWLEATVTIDGEKKTVTYDGTGSVDAIFSAIKEAVGIKPHLVLYAVDGVTGGTDAQASAHVRLELNGRIASGNAAEPDTLVASARAYLNAVNRLMIERGASAQGAMESAAS